MMRSGAKIGKRSKVYDASSRPEVSSFGSPGNAAAKELNLHFGRG